MLLFAINVSVNNIKMGRVRNTRLPYMYVENFLDKRLLKFRKQNFFFKLSKYNDIDTQEILVYILNFYVYFTIILV